MSGNTKGDVELEKKEVKVKVIMLVKERKRKNHAKEKIININRIKSRT